MNLFEKNGYETLPMASTTKIATAITALNASVDLQEEIIIPKNTFNKCTETLDAIKEEIFGKAGNGYLPEQVSLLEGFIILCALGDPIVCEEKGRGIDCLKRIRAMVFLRNNSIFAHGLGPVGVTDYMKFKKFVLETFQEFCRIERINFNDFQKNIAWINPMDSKNYVSGMGEK